MAELFKHENGLVKYCTTDQNGEMEWYRLCEDFLIAKKTKDLFQNTEVLTILWRDSIANRKTLASFSRGIIMDKPQFLAYMAGNGFSISSSDYDILIEYIYYSEKSNALKEYTYSFLGWINNRKEKVFLCSHLLSLSGKYNAATYNGHNKKAYIPKGSPETWLHGIETLVIPYHDTTLALILSYISVVLAYLGGEVVAPEVFIEYTGKSSTGKTTMLQLGASVWGNPNVGCRNSIIGNANATENALVEQLRNSSGIPMFIDETTILNSAVAKNFVYKVTSGVSRLRCKSNGELDELKNWSGALITSTEESMLDKHDPMAGEQVRTLSLNLPFTKSDEHSKELKNLANNNYGFGGIPFVYSVMRLGEKKILKMIKTEQNNFIKALEDSEIETDSLVDRRADFMGIIIVTAIILRQTFGFNYVIGEIRALLIDQYCKEQKNADSKQTPYERLKQILLLSPSNFSGQKICQECGKQIAYITTTRFAEICKKIDDIQPRVFAKQLKEQNLLYKHDSGKNTCRTKFNIENNSIECTAYAIILEEKTTLKNNRFSNKNTKSISEAIINDLID